MKRSITNGRWINITSEAHFNDVREPARVRKGDFSGPGKYHLLHYTQRCPRGCCEDEVLELIPANEFADEIREKMKELAELLRESR